MIGVWWRRALGGALWDTVRIGRRTLVDGKIILNADVSIRSVRTGNASGTLTNNSTAYPVNAGFVGDILPAIEDVPLSGDAALTCTVLEPFLSI